MIDLTEQVADDEQVRLDLAESRLETATGSLSLPAPPDFVHQIQREGGIVAYMQRYGKFPGES